MGNDAGLRVRRQIVGANGKDTRGGLAFVPSVDQALGVFEYLGIGLPRRPGRLYVSLGLPISFDLAAIEPHGRMDRRYGLQVNAPPPGVLG